MGFPTIFDWLEQFGFLRQYPAAYGVVGTAVLIVLVRDWRLALLALAAQYFFAGLLFVDVLDPRLAIIKLLVGWFVCLILYLTARQIHWNWQPEDKPSRLPALFLGDRQVRLGPVLLPLPIILRAAAVVLVVLVAFLLASQPNERLPAITEAMVYMRLAIYALVGLGLLGLILTTDPLQVGMSVLLFLSGFELSYSAQAQSFAMLLAFSAANFLTALLVSFWAQRRRAKLAFED